MTNVTLYDCLILDKKKREACSSPLFNAFACSVNLDVILQANALNNGEEHASCFFLSSIKQLYFKQIYLLCISLL